MNADNVLFQAFIFLLAAVVSVPIAKRLGLGSVLGYLLAGVVIGPGALNLVGSPEHVLHFSEFGVVMMLFLIGIELRPSLLWRLRVPILGLGGSQVIGAAACILGVAVACGVALKPALAIGLILAMSSTAIVLQSLSERGQLKLSAGQSCFSVLLFQDVAVIPIIALLPILGGTVAEKHGLIADLARWQRGLITFGVIITIIVLGRVVLRHVFRIVAATKLREVFTELTLLLIVGVALAMEAVGLSAALGAFVGGVVLADSEYRHQLEADLEPFKGILLGMFFTAVGAGIDLKLLMQSPLLIASLVAGLVLLKFGVQLTLARIFGMGWQQALLFALALSQAGEFCFVLLNIAQTSGVFGHELAKPLNAAVALSMAVTPFLFTLNDKVIQPLFTRDLPKPEREPDEIAESENPVILAGFGRFGHIVGRLLRANGLECTVLENDPEQIELLGRFGLQSYFGDATRPDLLAAAGAAKAKVFISTIADTEKSIKLVQTVQREFPHLHIFARAVSRQHAYELIRAGVKHVFRETVGSALDLGVAAMRDLGLRGVQAVRAARIFKKVDEESLHELAMHDGDDTSYVTRAKQHIANLERLLQVDRERGRLSADDSSWEIGSKTDQPEKGDGKD